MINPHTQHAKEAWQLLTFMNSKDAWLKYVASQGVWRLYCQHRDRRWHSYEALPEASSFAKLLDEVAEDPTGIFWG